MPTDVFETCTFTLWGEHLTGHKDGAVATFRISKNKRPLAAPTATVKNKRCRVEWDPPEVSDDEESYTLSTVMEIDGRSYPIEESFRVWPRWVQLNVKRATDDKAFQHLKILVKQGRPVAAITDLRGEYRAFLEKPGPVTFEAVPPGEFTSPPKSRGRRRSARARRTYKAAFVAPVMKGKGPLVQLVNLATKSKGGDQRGSLVEVKVGALGDTKRKPKDRLGHEGDVIYLKATFGRESKRNTPLPTLSRATDVARSADGKTVTAKVKLGPLGEPAAFDLELGLAGGDTCTLQAGTTDACADATLKFVNNRRIYYQLTYPRGLPRPSAAHMAAGLERVKVEYKPYRSRTFSEGDRPAAPKGSWFNGSMVSASLKGRCVNIGDHNRGHFHAKFVDTHNPVGVHVLVCHTQFDAGRGNAQLSRVGAVKIDRLSPLIRFPPGPRGKEVNGAVIDVSGVGGRVFEMAFQDGKTGWRSARWQSLAKTGKHKNKSGEIPDSHVNVRWRERPNIVTVKLPKAAVEVVDDFEEVRVTLDVYYARGPYNGEAVRNLQLIATRTPADGGERGMNATMLHELGHTMHQTLKRVPPGLAAADHGRKYTGRGHLGAHCAEGVAAAVFNDATKTLRGRGDCACVMFGEGAPQRPVSFCARCTPFVKAEDLRDITR